MFYGYEMGPIGEINWYVITTVWRVTPGTTFPVNSTASGTLSVDYDEETGDVWVSHPQQGLLKFNEHNPSLNQQQWPAIQAPGLCVYDDYLMHVSSPRDVIRRDKSNPNSSVSVYTGSVGTVTDVIQGTGSKFAQTKYIWYVRGTSIFNTFYTIWEYDVVTGALVNNGNVNDGNSQSVFAGEHAIYSGERSPLARFISGVGREYFMEGTTLPAGWTELILNFDPSIWGFRSPDHITYWSSGFGNGTRSRNIVTNEDVATSVDLINMTWTYLGVLGVIYSPFVGAPYRMEIRSGDLGFTKMGVATHDPDGVPMHAGSYGTSVRVFQTKNYWWAWPTSGNNNEIIRWQIVYTTGVIPDVPPIQGTAFSLTNPSIVKPYGPSHPTYMVVLLAGSSIVPVSAGRVVILDFADPNNPVLVGQSVVDTTQDPEFDIRFPCDFLIVGDYLYVIGELWSFATYDISDPTNITLAAQFANTSGCAVAPLGNPTSHYAIAVRLDDRVRCYSLSPDPTTPIAQPTGSIGSFGGALSDCVNIVSWLDGGIWRAAVRCISVGTGGTIQILSWNSGLNAAPSLSAGYGGVGGQFTGEGGMVYEDGFLYVVNDMTSSPPSGSPIDRYYVSILDVSNPSAPTLVSAKILQRCGNSPVTTHKEGDILWTLDAGQRMVAIDVSDVTNIRRIRSHIVQAGSNTVVDQYIGWPITIGQTRYMIVSDGFSAVRAYTLPGMPDSYVYLYNLVPGVGATGGISTQGGRMLVTFPDTDTVQLYDISDPDNIVTKDSITHGTQLNMCQGVVLDGNYGYVVSFGNYMQIIDVTDPNNLAFPIGGGVYNSSTYLRDPKFIVKQGEYVYCTAGDPDNNNSGRLTIINVTNKQSPVLAGSVADQRLYCSQGLPNEQHLCVQGDFVYVATESTFLGNRAVAIVDVSNKAAPYVRSEYRSSLFDNDIYGIIVEGDFVYVTSSGNRLTILNISNPDSPQLASTITLNSNAATGRGIRKNGDWLYVTSSSAHSVTWVNVSDPYHPTFNSADALADEVNLFGINLMDIHDDLLYILRAAGGGLSVVTTL